MRTPLALVSAALFASLGLTACSEQSVFEIPVGSCAASDSFGVAAEGVLESLPLIDCAEPHDLEAFATMDLEGDEFPGDASLKETADAFCIAEFESFVGVSYTESELSVTYFAPTADSWDRSGDREVLCWVVSTEPVTGTLQGAAR